MHNPTGKTTPEETIRYILKEGPDKFVGSYADDIQRYENQHKIMKSQFDYVFEFLVELTYLSKKYTTLMLELRQIKQEILEYRSKLDESYGWLKGSVEDWEKETINPDTNRHGKI